MELEYLSEGLKAAWFSFLAQMLGSDLSQYEAVSRKVHCRDHAKSPLIPTYAAIHEMYCL